MRIPIFLFLLFPILTSMGQHNRYIDVEAEKFPGIKKMTIQTFHRHNAKQGYRAIYSFDENGNAIEASYFLGRKRLSNYKFSYNEKGGLAKKVQTYNVNSKGEITTTIFFYELDTNGRVILKTKCWNNWKTTNSYHDFDSNNNPQTVISEFGNLTWTEKIKYDSLNKAILIQRLQNDSITDIEEMRYNEFGDMIYSYIPTLLDKETGKMKVSFGENRYSMAEEYEYVYDQSGRWIEKYVVFDNKKVLFEKRIFEKRSMKQ